jgi:DNA polymerase
VVKCRPPNNRTPEADEITQCLPYLQRQIALIKPKLIVALGKTAATALLGRDATLGSLRGTIHDYQGVPLIVTYHPAYLLRSPAEKARAWQDLNFAVSAHSAR